jgi:SEC-C motif-containing protein
MLQNKEVIMDQTCPCHSGKEYTNCCKPFHLGTKLPDPVELMRSRYAAFALGLSDYIIKTTHKGHIDQKKDQRLWKKEIEMFSECTEFCGLKIEQSQIEKDRATVTFIAFLKQDGIDVSLAEQSLFLKEGDEWKYHSGKILNN